jgi:hypothetical protein
VLRAAGETETTQENIQDWLELDDGNPGFQLLTEGKNYCSNILYLFSSALPIYIIKSSIYLFLNFWVFYRLIFPH